MVQVKWLYFPIDTFLKQCSPISFSSHPMWPVLFTHNLVLSFPTLFTMWHYLMFWFVHLFIFCLPYLWSRLPMSVTISFLFTIAWPRHQVHTLGSTQVALLFSHLTLWNQGRGSLAPRPVHSGSLVFYGVLIALEVLLFFPWRAVHVHCSIILWSHPAKSKSSAVIILPWPL